MRAGPRSVAGRPRIMSGMAKLYFYYSAMNAGKTTTLLQSAHNYRERGMRVLVFTPAQDDRAGKAGVVASRIGLRSEGMAFGRDDDLQARTQADIAEHGKLDCVLVDEAQFLSKAQVWQLSEVVDKLRIPVLTYGLRTDFRGELFEGSQYLLAWADELTEIKTICHTGKKATMTVRVDERGRAVQAGPQVEIGGNDRYVSVSGQSGAGARGPGCAVDRIARRVAAGRPPAARDRRDPRRLRADRVALRRQSSSEGCTGSMVLSPRITFLNSARETDT